MNLSVDCASVPCDTRAVFFHVGDVIRKLRLARSLGLEAFAEASKVNKGTISAIERGATNFERDTLEKIAGALGTTPEGLYGLLRDTSVTASEPPLKSDLARHTSRGKKRAAVHQPKAGGDGTTPAHSRVLKPTTVEEFRQQVKDLAIQLAQVAGNVELERGPKARPAPRTATRNRKRN